MAWKKTELKAMKTRRRYPDEFKEEAVQMLLDGHTAPSVCQRLGLPTHSVEEPVWVFRRICG